MLGPSRTPTNLVVTYCAISVCILIVRCFPQLHTNASEPANQTALDARSHPTSELQPGRLSSRVLLIMKLLQLAHQYTSQNSALRPNSSTSESRSMSSWFRLKKPAQRQESQHLLDRSGIPHQDFARNGPPRPPFPLGVPANYGNNFGKPNDPNSFFFVPSISDTTGIDYWLKFIEEANLGDDRNAPLFLRSNDKLSSKLKPIPLVKRVKGRPKSKSDTRKTVKLRQDGSKHSTDGDDYESDISESNDLMLDPKSTGSNKVLKQVVEYDTSPRCDKFTDEICIDDFEYPEHAILDEIIKRKDIFQLMYSEVKGDAPMVDGIPRDEEENFSQDYYYNNNDNDSEDYDGYPVLVNRTQHDLLEDAVPAKAVPEKNNRVGGFVCRSEVLYAKPKLARNIKGKWRVIVNAGDFTQTVRMEKCTKPNSECRFIADHKSRCAQISAIHRLLVFEKGKGFYIDTFRVPTACTCHVHSTKHEDTKKFPGVGSSNSLSVKRDKAKSNLGDTLWSLLGTEPEKGRQPDNGNRNFMLLPDQSKAGLNLDLLKLLPQLTSIAPESVLQQLLEDYTDQNSQQKGYGHRVSNFPLGGGQTPVGELQQLLLSSLKNNPPRGDVSKEADKRLVDKSMTQPHPSTTTTIVNPSGGSGAPVVQVIHVPVSSEIMTSDLDTVTLEPGRPPARNRFRPIYSYNGPAKSLPKHSSKFHISSNSNYLQSQSKTNSSVAPPPLLTDGKAVEKPKAAEEGGKDIQQILDKKINFSYHPILEYIVH